MPKTVTTLWDPAEHLHTDEDMAAYLEAAFEEGDPALVAAALGDIAKAKGMSRMARDAGLGRASPRRRRAGPSAARFDGRGVRGAGALGTLTNGGAKDDDAVTVDVARRMIHR